MVTLVAAGISDNCLLLLLDDEQSSAGDSDVIEVCDIREGLIRSAFAKVHKYFNVDAAIMIGLLTWF
jgi:hypothetical protein